jgi:hypothetical protein
VRGQHRVGVRAQLRVNREDSARFSQNRRAVLLLIKTVLGLMEEILRALLLTGNAMMMQATGGASLM